MTELLNLLKKHGIACVVSFAFVIPFLTATLAALQNGDERVRSYVAPLFTITVALVLLSFGLAKTSSDGCSNVPCAGCRHTMKLRLMQRHQFRFIGLYRAARELCLRSGRDVVATGDGHGNTGDPAESAYPALEIVEGGSFVGLDPRATVSNRLDDLGVTSATALIRWHLQHHNNLSDGQRLVPLLVIFERSPSCLVHRVQGALPAVGIERQHLTGMRFRVLDLSDPIAMEFRALCEREPRIHNLQWDLSIAPDSDRDEPLACLGVGGSADFRLGSVLDEGYRAQQRRERQRATYGVTSLAKVFDKEILYGDVLFTRKELLDSDIARPALDKIVGAIRDSYTHFLDASKESRLDDVHELMEIHCRDWWRSLIGAKPYVSVAQDLIGQLQVAWGRRDAGRPLGTREGWKELEQGVLAELKVLDANKLPHLDWLTKSPGAMWLGSQTGGRLQVNEVSTQSTSARA